MRDLEIINAELILKDLELVEKRFAKAEAEARTGKKEAIQDKELLGRLKACLEAGRLPVADVALANEIAHEIATTGRLKDVNLLTLKRQIYLLNGTPADVPQALTEKLASLGAHHIVIDLSSAQSVPELVREAYATLNLISFFTTGEDETRAWTIEQGTKAPQAAGVIHTDFEKKFIRLEVVACDKLLIAGNWAAAKQKGWLRVEGKDYVVQDGDVLEVRHG